MSTIRKVQNFIAAKLNQNGFTVRHLQPPTLKIFIEFPVFALKISTYHQFSV